MARLRKAAHGEALELTDHLDELRTRVFVCIAVVAIATGLAFWQNHLLLSIANGPLPGEREPLTLGVTEPFFTTMKLSLYGGILLSLPILLHQAYAFVLPAISPAGKRSITPFLFMVPVLFIAGVLFAYAVVVPAATEFLLNFNSTEFNIQVRASDYYGFFILTLSALGLMFQIPAGMLALTRLGVVTPEQLARNRRYAVLGIAVAAMFLPGTDPVTMALAMVPLYGLYELSVQTTKLIGHRRRPRSESSVESSADARA